MSQRAPSLLVWAVIVLTALMGLASGAIEDVAAALASTARWDALDLDDAEDAGNLPSEHQGTSIMNFALQRHRVRNRLIVPEKRPPLSTRSTTDRHTVLSREASRPPFDLLVSLRI